MAAKFKPPLNNERRKSRRVGPAARRPKYGGGKVKAHRAHRAALEAQRG